MAETSVEIITHQILKKNREFYEAIENQDIVLLKNLWLFSDESSCVHPGWHRVKGFIPILETWEAIFKSNTQMHFSLQDITVSAHSEIAVVNLTERVIFELLDDVSEFKVNSTNIFKFNENEWKMMVHHASPILEQR